MTTDTVPQTVLFPDLFDKPLFARFNQEQASSDGGAILLKAAERIYGLVKAFAGYLVDKRAPNKTRHSLADLIGQRIFGIACGHPDCNDGDRLADDPTSCCSTETRFRRAPSVAADAVAVRERSQRLRALPHGGRVGHAGHRAASPPPGRAGAVHHDRSGPDGRPDARGAVGHALFNGYYDNWCYLPLLGFLTFDRESEQYLCAALLRHGKAVASEGTGRAVVAVAAAAAPGVSFPLREGLLRPAGTPRTGSRN